MDTPNANDAEQNVRSGRTKNLTFGPRTKECSGCGARAPIKKNVCEDCGVKFEKKTKTIEERLPKYKTNITQQTDKLKIALNTLNRDHDQNIIVFTAKRNKDGSECFDVISSKGWASEFIGRREENGSLPNVMTRAFKKGFREYTLQKERNGAEGETSRDSGPSNNTLPSKMSDNKTSDMNDNDVRSKDDEKKQIPDVPEEEKVLMKSPSELSSFDVLACYTKEEENEKFWLFLVERTVEDHINGRWFQRKPGTSHFELDMKRTQIKVDWVVRVGVEHDMLYVLPKHGILDLYYKLSPKVESMLAREAESIS